MTVTPEMIELADRIENAGAAYQQSTLLSLLREAVVLLLRSQASPPPQADKVRRTNDGKPFYCVTCGAGWSEFGACEEVDCKLESECTAAARAAMSQASPPPLDDEVRQTIEPLLVFHETGGHEGDGSDERLAMIRAALSSCRIGGDDERPAQ